MEKPDVDIIEGLSPAIAIKQRAPSHNPRSTVGTVTEIYDYLRLLYARIGIPHCPECGRRIEPQSAQQIIDKLLSLPEGTKVQILSPLVMGRIGTYVELFSRFRQSGYVRVRVDGKVYSLEENIKLARYKKHNIELVVDRITISGSIRERLADSVETALRESKGTVLADITSVPGAGKRVKCEHIYSEHHSCTHCGISLPEIEPRMFSFNSPYGACSECDGLGTKLKVDPALVVPVPSLSVREGALKPWTSPITTRTHRWKYSWSSYYEEILRDVCRRHNIQVNKPFNKLSIENRNILLYGRDDFEGVVTNLARRYKETESDYVKEEIYNNYIRKKICPRCLGARLKKESLSVLVNNKPIAEISSMSVTRAGRFFSEINLTEKEKVISRQILKEIKRRLAFLINVGLDYITLDRESFTLAGGEAQRIHLATQIGSGLTGVLYVLDEPTIGLHYRDNKRLLNTLLRLRDLGNTLLIVEHDEETIRAGDWIIDLGPGAGRHGGEVVTSGKLENVLRDDRSLTGKYLKGKLRIPVPGVRRAAEGKYLEITGAEQFNRKKIDIKIPLKLFVCVTGVSGSGKSTLVYEILYKALAQKLYHSKDIPGRHKSIKGTDNIDKVIIVDQSPIGRTPRSNPSTYTGLFTPIRDLFAQLPEARRKGYTPGRFSFNVKGGRCENCKGDGTLKITRKV
jgi:excinuclease ABC subunit A